MSQTPKPSRSTRADASVGMRTLVLTAAFLIFGFGILIYQLYGIQLRDDEQYRTEAVTQQLSDTVIPATRGSIYSSTGKLLAKSTTVWNIIADPSYTAENEIDTSYLRTASEKIAELLDDGTTADSLYEKLTDSEKQYKIIAKGVEKPVADEILAYADEFRTAPADGEEQGTKVLSLRTEQSATRSYPYGSFLSSVLGFCDSDGNGFYGLEKSYDDILSGTDGRSVTTTNVNGEALDDSEADVHEAVDGGNLTLTVDEYVQSVAEEYLTQAAEDFDVHSRACAIVMNVKTGAILAMATVGQFDPNDPYTIADTYFADLLPTQDENGSWSGGALDADSIDRLECLLGEDEVADIVADGLISAETTTDAEGNTVSSERTQLQGMLREAQWKNKNITELYYPGSVFKLVTASAGLDSGQMDPSQTFYCDSNLVVNEGSELWEHTYRCALNTAHGMLDLAGALNHSCNLYFIQAAQKMSPAVWYSYFTAFGFTQTTGIDLPNETRWMSYYTEEELESVNTNFYTASFGQNMAITPLQMATAVAAVANGGYLVTPYIVDSVTDSDGNIVQQNSAAVRRQVISEEVSTTLLAMMEDNVGHGDDGYHSCKNAYVAGYRIGGKSGTAEKLTSDVRWDGDYKKTMSFAAVLPVDDPEIEVFVVMDDPRYGNDLASSVVAPVAGNIISEIAPYLGLEQDPDYAPTGTVTVANCVDSTWTDAQVSLNVQGLGHKLIGSSGTIVYQYPYAGTTVPAGSTVYLYTTTDQDEMTVVPDVTGKTGSFAVQMLKAAGLNADLQGSEDAQVIAQSAEANTSAAMGTVVTLTVEEVTEEAEEAAEQAAEETTEEITAQATGE